MGNPAKTYRNKKEPNKILELKSEITKMKTLVHELNPYWSELKRVSEGKSRRKICNLMREKKRLKENDPSIRNLGIGTI